MTAALSLEGAAGLALATFVFAAIPGPGVTAVVSQALARGLKSGLLWGFGIVLGDCFYLLLAMLGLSLVAQQLGWAFVILKWAGAAYLVYLGLRCLLAKAPQSSERAAENAAGNAAPQPEHTSLARTFLGGFCVSLGNPKVVAFYCGFLPGFVDMRALSGLDMFLVAATILPTCYSVIALYAWLASRGRNAVRGGRVWKYANRGAGAVMIGAGLAVAAD
ncbi:MAG TPA: LysE family translocator [Humidesulfovibrio sp.]|uniref:LysE family translocator n=1 Tax=Humidesulfovibrio sp. TaxID=2910988 RepID=UPI002B527641|nr:LysE family translocator [Humidesulfovibrio sp.]HWR04008.1 LysE family translocator [Humidesulfovibrio sp.]